MRVPVLLAVALASCGGDPLTEQLERMKAARPEANAVETVTCGTGETCAQARLIKGDACFRVRDWDCAAAELGAGLAGAPETGPLGRRRDYAAERLEALRSALDAARDGATTAAGIAALDAAAREFHAAYPADAAGAFYLATARVAAAEAALAGGADACAPLNEAEELAAGAGSPGALAPQLHLLADDLALLRPAACGQAAAGR